MLIDQLKPNIIIRGPIFPEPVQIIVFIPMGDSVKLIGKGLKSQKFMNQFLMLNSSQNLNPHRKKSPLTEMQGNSALASKHCDLDLPMNMTRTFLFPSQGLTLCLTSLKQFMITF